MKTDPKKMQAGSLFFWFMSLLGLIYAAVIGNGSELPRLAVILPLMLIGALGCSVLEGRRLEFFPLLGIGVVAGYLLIRGGMSPVWDLARRDLFLIVSGVTAYVAASSALQLRTGRRIFLGIIILLILGNAVVAFSQFQIDGGISFLRGRRADQAGVSGFYYHRNYLAGFLEIAFPILVGVCVSRKHWVTMLHLAGWTMACATLCFLTNSRGGFSVMVVSGLVVFVLERLRFVWQKGKTRTAKRQVLVVGSLIVSCMLIAGGGYFLLQEIFENRGGAGSSSGSLTGRLRMAGVAVDIWLQNPLFGMGAESYSYFFPKLISGFGGWFGNATMVHSDYLQLLSDYGIVGFLLVIVLIGGIGFQLLRRNEYVEEKSVECSTIDGGLWLRSAAAGALIAEVLRAVFDFNLHVAPNLILFAIVIGGGVHAGNSFSVGRDGIEKGKQRSGFWSQLFALLLVLGMGGYGLWAGWREITHAGGWVEVEKLKAREENSAEALRSYSEKAPSFKVLRTVAHHSLSMAIKSNRGDEFLLASEDWRKVVERHPYDGESLANYARCLDETKLFKEAENYHLQALEAVSRREHNYGVIYGVGWHLMKRGELALGRRRSGEALFLFEKAAEAFEFSYQRNFSRKTLNRSARDWVKGRIEFLEGARIEPVGVRILDWRSAVN